MRCDGLRLKGADVSIDSQRPYYGFLDPAMGVMGQLENKTNKDQDTVHVALQSCRPSVFGIRVSSWRSECASRSAAAGWGRGSGGPPSPKLLGLFLRRARLEVLNPNHPRAHPSPHEFRLHLKLSVSMSFITIIRMDALDIFCKTAARASHY